MAGALETPRFGRRWRESLRSGGRRIIPFVADDLQPGGVAGFAPIHRGLNLPDRLPPDHLPGPATRFQPDTRHLRIDLAAAGSGHPATGAVTQLFAAVHGT